VQMHSGGLQGRTRVKQKTKICLNVVNTQLRIVPNLGSEGVYPNCVIVLLNLPCVRKGKNTVCAATNANNRWQNFLNDPSLCNYVVVNRFDISRVAIRTDDDKMASNNGGH